MAKSEDDATKHPMSDYGQKKIQQQQDHHTHSSRRVPDNGQPYMGPNFTAPDCSPRPLDHFKRGYGERMESRDRETTGFTNDPKSWQPPPVGTLSVGIPAPTCDHRDHKGHSNYYGPATAMVTGVPKRQPHCDGWNDDSNNRSNKSSRGGVGEFNKYDEKMHMRSLNGCVDQRQQGNNDHLLNNDNFGGNYKNGESNGNIGKLTGANDRGGHGGHNKHAHNHNRHNSNHHGGAGGFSMEEFVVRLCHPHTASVYNELNHTRATSPESFISGRAITAILSQLGRRRQMRVAQQVWSWMDKTVPRIIKNVFHYNALINVCEKSKDWKGALDLLHQMDTNGVGKNEITYSSAISACEKGGNWRVALDLLSTMKEQRIMPTAIAYNAAISACEKGLNPSKALEIFEEMKRDGIRPTVVTFSALISACEKGQQWKLALKVLEELKTTFGPNVIAYSAAISALSKGQQWEKAWELFCEIQMSGEKLSVVTYNATMTALEKGLQWERALNLFDEMKFKGMPVTVVSYGSAISACEKGYQWRQCLEYLDEMTERNIPKNVIIFGAAMSCMEKSCRADIAFQLLERMKLEEVLPNVHVYNSAISACARCKLWQKGLDLFLEMDEVGVKRDVVTYNAVLDAVCSQVNLAEKIFHEGVSRGFYAKVSRLGTQWLELDLHFLSLGGGETALRWWFEKCLAPYLCNNKELALVKSIDIVTGYGKTRARGMRKGDDSMRKRVRAMLSFMNVSEVTQPNLGRIHIDKEALVKEVEKNFGRIIFDAHGYEMFKLQEGLDEPYSDTQQFVRPRGGAMHDQGNRDGRQEQPYQTTLSHGCRPDPLHDNFSGYGSRCNSYGDKVQDLRATNPSFELSTVRHSQLPQDNKQSHYRRSLSWQSPPPRSSPYYDRKRPFNVVAGSNPSHGSTEDQWAQAARENDSSVVGIRVGVGGVSCNYSQEDLLHNTHSYPPNKRR